MAPICATQPQPAAANLAGELDKGMTQERSSLSSSSSLAVPPGKSLRRALGLPPRSFSRKPNHATSPSSTPPKVFGHRGAVYDEVENTRPAFQRCAALGVDGVELDVFLIKDGSLVVFHGGGTDERPGDYSRHMVESEDDDSDDSEDGDDDEDMEADGSSIDSSKSILDLTYDECLRLRFNPKHPEFVCPSDRVVGNESVIPLLKDVLVDLKETGAYAKIELKGKGTAVPVVKLVEDLDMVEQCSFSSFDHSQIKALRKFRPEVDPITGRHVFSTAALFTAPEKMPHDFIQRALDVGADEVHLRYDACTVERVKEIHEAGLGSMAWFRGPLGMQSDLESRFWDVGSTATMTTSCSGSKRRLEDAATYRAVLETGVQQICVNRPDIALNVVKIDFSNMSRSQ